MFGFFCTFYYSYITDVAYGCLGALLYSLVRGKKINKIYNDNNIGIERDLQIRLIQQVPLPCSRRDRTKPKTLTCCSDNASRSNSLVTDRCDSFSRYICMICIGPETRSNVDIGCQNVIHSLNIRLTSSINVLMES